MWVMNMGKPDTIPPLNEKMAIELGANLLGESIVFVVAAGAILMEYSRQVRKETTKEALRQEEMDEVVDKIRDLSIQVKSQDMEIERLKNMMGELNNKVIRIPWKGPLKHSTDDKHESNVTKEASNFVGKNESEKKR